MPNSAQIADILFKQSLGLGDTSTGRQFFQEPVPSRLAIYPNQIWADLNLVPNTAPGISSGIVQYLTGYQLTGVVGTTNSFTGALLKQAIPFNYGDGTSYNYSLFDSQGGAIPFGTNDWTIDTNGGILLFNNGVPANMPPTINFYRYSGTLGLGNYITTGQTGVFVTTSQTGQFVTTSQTGSFGGGGNTGVLTGVFYPLNTNPSNYATLSQIGVSNLNITGYNLTGNITITGISGISVTTGNSSEIIIGINTGLFASAVNLSTTGSYLFGLINASSTGVSSLNSASGALTLAGAGNVTVTTAGQTITISGNTGAYSNFVYTGQTGNFVSNGQTGNFVTIQQTGLLVNTFYPLNTNPQHYITNLQTGVFVTTGNTGIFVTIYQTGNLNYVTPVQSGLLTGVFAQLNSNNIFTENNTFSGGNIILNNNTNLIINSGGGQIEFLNYINPNNSSVTYNFGISGAFHIISGNFNVCDMLNRILYTAPGSCAIDWQNRLLEDNQGNGSTSVDWNNRCLEDSENDNGPGITSVDWENRYLEDGNATVQFNNPTATNPGNVSIDYGNRLLYDAYAPDRYGGIQGFLSMDWGNRYLYDINGILSIDYSNRILSGLWNASGLSVLGNKVITSNQTGIFVTIYQTGGFGGSGTTINTGVLTGTFYPLNSNPSGFITGLNTGNFIYQNYSGNINLIGTADGTGLSISGGGLNMYEGTPTIVGVLSGTSLAGAGWVRVVGRYAYMTADAGGWSYPGNSSGLSIIDVENPSQPTLISQINTTPYAGTEGIDICGKYAYISHTASGNSVQKYGVSVIDISNPKSPLQVGYVTANPYLQYCETIMARGNYLYVGTAYNGPSGDYLTVVDISNPTNPLVVGYTGSLSLRNTAGMQIKGKYAYVNGGASSLGHSGSLNIIDVSNSINPIIVGNSVPIVNYPAYGVKIDGKYAYVVGSTGLYIIDISNPLSFSCPIVGSVQVSTATMWTLEKNTNYVYVTDFTNNCIRTFNVSNPTNPYLVSTLTDNFNLNHVDDIYCYGNYLYCANSGPTGRLTILKIGGTDIPGANIGNIFANEVNIGNRLVVGGDAKINDSLSVGPLGIYSQGTLSILGSGNFLSGVNISGQLNISGYRAITTADTGNFISTSTTVFNQSGVFFNQVTVQNLSSSTIINSGTFINSGSGNFISGLFVSGIPVVTDYDYRAGTVTFNTSQSTYIVLFSGNLPSTNYSVSLRPNNILPATLTSLWANTKTVSGFTINNNDSYTGDNITVDYTAWVYN